MWNTILSKWKNIERVTFFKEKIVLYGRLSCKIFIITSFLR